MPPVRFTWSVHGHAALTFKFAGLLLAGWCLVGLGSPAAGLPFTNLLGRAALAEARGDIRTAAGLYRDAEATETTNAPHLCALARRYCRLTYLTNSAALQQELVKQALACSLQAVKVNATNAEAHACLAVAYAKSCAWVDLRTRLAYSRLFKHEAETAIALDPRQDIAYYLLGRWNYELAKVGFLSRTWVKLVYGGLPNATYQEAIADFQRAVALAPERIIHHAGLAMAYAAAGDDVRAAAEWRRCQAMHPAGPEDEAARRDALEQLARLGQK